MKKTVFVLNIDNYAPEITKLTYPLIRHYAKRIGADFHVITKRKFPGWPPVYEKLQIYTLGREMKNDWNIYIDSDAVVHPETIDFTGFLPMDTVMHNGNDFAPIRWDLDHYFLRDGRNIGSCNWLTFGSSWCIDLWEPLSDLTFKEALSRIHATVGEINSGIINDDHLIDDYTLSRNIAKYGLKFTTVRDLQKKIGLNDAVFFYHEYTYTREQKAKKIYDLLHGTEAVLAPDGRIEWMPWKLTEFMKKIS